MFLNIKTHCAFKQGKDVVMLLEFQPISENILKLSCCNLTNAVKKSYTTDPKLY